MTKTEALNKNVALDFLNYYIELGRIYVVPMSINQEAYIVVNGLPSKVIVTDIAIHSIQLSGAWYTWEQLEAMGGVYSSAFDALKAVQPAG